jgi:DNA-binding XRE family transcriptional regulator
MIRKRRLELGLFQKEVAFEIGVSEDCLTYWENNRSIPQVKYYPKIIEFLGNFPFGPEPSTLGLKIIHYRYRHGLTQEELAQKLNIHESTVFRYEKGVVFPSKRVLHNLNSLIGLERSQGGR